MVGFWPSGALRIRDDPAQRPAAVRTMSAGMRLPVVDMLRPSPAPPAGVFETGPRSIAAVRVLRISVTDRCNFRCVYCMPEEGVRWLPKEGILSFEEIAHVVRAAIAEHGIRRFKLTGGEPTIRHGIVDLVRMLRAIDGIDDLSLTTNGMLLESLAGPLREAGLDRVTVSIDSLDSNRFRAITRTGDLASVMRGLDRCAAVGFTGLKINCVTMRGTNDDEVADFARLTLNRPLTVRFIEYMPLGDAALMHVTKKVEGGRMKDEKEAAAASLSHPSTVIVQPSQSGPAGGCGAQDRGADAFI
ncbi:MAG: 3,8-cyclase, partial [Humisphaera sp.]|nr:3,8-cyclase [Humisphaera sp.]